MARAPRGLNRFLLDREHPVPPRGLNSVWFIGIVLVLALMTIIPLYWMVATAFTPAALTVRFPPEIIPSNPTLRKDRKSTRLNSSHVAISYAVFCLKKKKTHTSHTS